MTDNPTLTVDEVTSRPGVASVLAHPLAAKVDASDPRLPRLGVLRLFEAELAGATLAETFELATTAHDARVRDGLRQYAADLDAVATRDSLDGYQSPKAAPQGAPGVNVGDVTATFLALVDHAAAGVLGWLTGTRRPPLDDDLETLIRAALTGRSAPSQAWVQAIMTRLGAAGTDPATLDAAAAPVGVTRERVRQVEAKVLARFAKHPTVVPQLDEIADIAGQPITTEELTDVLLQAGLTRRPFTPKALTAVATLVGHPLRVQDRAGVIGADDDTVKLVRRTARSLTTNPGAGSVEQVAAMVDADVPLTGAALTDLVRQVIDSDSKIRWCGPGKTVFRAQGANEDRVRMRNVILQMLAVSPTGQLTTRDLFDGISRKAPFRRDAQGRVRSTSLPVVRAFVADHPEFVLTGDVVRPAVAADYHDLVGESVAILVDILREADEGVLDRTTLLAQASERGVNSTTAGMWLTFNPCLRSYGWAAWGVVGANPSTARLAEITESMRSQFETADKTDGIDERGRPWFSLKVSRSFLNQGVLSMAWHPHLADRKFDVVLPDGTAAGRVTFSSDHNFVWGWLPALKLLDVKHGQRLRAAFDVSDSTCHVTVTS